MSDERQEVPACHRTFSWVPQPDPLRPNQINMKLLFAPCMGARCAGFRVESGIPFCGLAGPVDKSMFTGEEARAERMTEATKMGLKLIQE